MKLTFVKKQNEIGNVWSYFFKPKSSALFEAGQYINLTMPDVPPAVADRIFTIASAPHQENLQFTTMRGESLFKQKLDTLEPGELIEADQIGGDFMYNLNEYQLKQLSSQVRNNFSRMFIAGGIGVTPYISMIRDRLYKKLPMNAQLLYAGKQLGKPFINEIFHAKELDKSLVFLDYTTKRLTLSVLKEEFNDTSKYLIYLAGSQQFVEGLGNSLIEAGHPRSQIKYDYFDGYWSLEY